MRTSRKPSQGIAIPCEATSALVAGGTSVLHPVPARLMVNPSHLARIDISLKDWREAAAYGKASLRLFPKDRLPWRTDPYAAAYLPKHTLA